MRRMFLVVSGVALGLALMSQATARASKAQDAAVIDKTMKAVGPAFGAARKAVEAGDMAAAKAAAETLSKAFVETEAFFKSHGKADGVEWAQGAKKAADALAAAASADAAKAPAGELGKFWPGLPRRSTATSRRRQLHVQARRLGPGRCEQRLETEPQTRAPARVAAASRAVSPAPCRALAPSASPARADARPNTSSYIDGA